MRNSLQRFQNKMQSADRKKEARRFAKFATVGAFGFLTHFTIVNVLVQIFAWAEVWANPVGFTAAVVQNFFLNRRWTFPESRVRDARRQLGMFFLVSVTGLVLNQIVFTVVHTLLEQYWIGMVGSERLGHALSYNFALCVAVGVVLFWNFAANRLWTYRGLGGVSEPADEVA